MRSRLPVSRLTTSTDVHALHLSIAPGFLSRLRGLMLAPPLAHSAGLLLKDCTSVHTCFMLQEIDVLYVDAGGTIVKCVPELAPWRVSFGNDASGDRQKKTRARHVIELRSGSIARMGIAVGSTVDHSFFMPDAGSAATCANRAAPAAIIPIIRNLPSRHDRGASMTEFTIVAPILTLIGLAILQYGLLFFARNQYNHAAFMAARAGSTGNADLPTIRRAYVQALVPLYGGGVTTTELATSFGKAMTDVNANAVVDMLNPTTESFSDWNDEALQATLGGGAHRVIPNGGLAKKNPAILPAASGQNIHDANLLKLRITHGYKPQVPVVGPIYAKYLKWLDPGTSSVNTELISRGRIPVVLHVTMHMQSDAIEGKTTSSPGMGNGGAPSNPGPASAPRENPPTCASALCMSTAPPAGLERGTGVAGGGGQSEPGQAGTAEAGGGKSAPGGICLNPAG